MRVFILFSGFLLLTLASVAASGKQSRGVCVRLVGVVQDFATRRPLAASLWVRSGNSRSALGSSAEGTGQFNVEVACTATVLLIERTGYRPQRLPLNLNTFTAVDDVYVVIPLVATDQQGTDRPYLQTEQTHYVQPTGSQATGQIQHSTFTVTDALTGLPLRAGLCFFFTKTGQKTCLDTDAAGNCKTDFADKDIVAMEVQSAGYQSYQGNISVERLGGPVLHHTVRLLRELILLSVQTSVQPTLKLQGMLRPEGGKKPVLLASIAGKPGFFTVSDLLPNRYELLLLNQQQTVLHRQTITLSPGLNVQTITLPGPKPAPPAARPTVPERMSTPASVTVLPAAAPPAAPVLTDNLPMLFFEEGQTTLSAAAQAILQQVGSYMQQHPEVHLRLVGHTDRLGDEQLNQYLGEFRAKVAASHLHWQWGIADERLQIVGFGSRFQVGAADNAESRSRNRRVTLKFVPARSGAETANSTNK